MTAIAGDVVVKKRGRQKGVKADRYPGGRVKQPYQRKTQMDVVTSYRIKASDRMFGSPLGHLVLKRHITPLCYEAGVEYEKRDRAFCALMGMCRPGAAALMRSPGRKLEPDPFDEDVERQHRKIEDDYRKAVAALDRLPNGQQVKRAVDDLCIAHDYEPHKLALYRQGLATLAVALRLTRNTK